MREGLRAAGLPEAAVQVVETTDRAAVGELLRMNEYVDIIVPRGGKGLFERVMDESRIPMIKHLDGVCHVYIDDRADLEQGDPHRRQREDAALRHLQHDGDAAGARGDRAAGAAARSRSIYLGKGVELRGDERARARSWPRRSKPATEQDWYTE